MRKVFDFISEAKIEKFVATWFTLLMIAIMFLNVVLRFGFDFAFNWGDEIVRYLNLYAAFFATSAVFGAGGHIAINVFVEQFVPKSAKSTFRLIAEIVCLAFCLFLVYQGFGLISKLMRSGQLSPGLRIPMYMMYMVIPIGMILSSAQVLIRIFYRKSYRQANNDYV